MVENTVLRRIFGPWRDEITAERRRLHSEELHDLYSSPNIRVTKLIRIRWAGHVALIGDRKVAYRIIVGILEGRAPPGRIRCRWACGSLRN